MKNTRAGLSLIELLLVIGILALLSALTSPAIQAARHSARRLSCSIKLRQLGLAVEMHRGAKNRMPSGTMAKTTQHPFTGLLLHLTPYLEQDSVFSKSTSEFQSSSNPFEHSSLKNAMSPFLCPEDDRIQGPIHSVRYNTTVGGTSFLGVNGTSAEYRDGVFFMGSKTKDAEITDGLSNTLLLGERPPSKYFDLGWWYAGVGADEKGTLDHTLGVAETTATPFKQCSNANESTAPSLDDECSARFFWSLHGNGIHFAKCDASVHFLSFHTDRSVLKALATRRGSEVISD
jgi:prepilin-type N-terminal cleavage/methylation domain-containing protein